MVRPLQLDRRVDHHPGPHAGRQHALYAGQPVGGFQYARLLADQGERSPLRLQLAVQHHRPAVGRRGGCGRARSACPLKVTDKNSWGMPEHLAEQQSDQLRQPDQQPVHDRRQGLPGRGQLLLGHRQTFAAHGRRVSLQPVPQVGNEFPRGQFFFTGAVHRQRQHAERRLLRRRLPAGRHAAASISRSRWSRPISAITNGRPISTTPGRSRRA